MLQSFICTLMAILCLSLSPLHVRSQCMISPPYPVCSVGDPQAKDGDTIQSGQHYCYGATGSFDYLKLNGGWLLVDGDLYVDRFEMDSGTIFIKPGARLVIGNGIGYGLIIKGNAAFYNAGTLEIIRNLSMDNGYASADHPNLIINEAGATFKMNNQYLVINNANSWFVNNGKAYFHGIITDYQSPAGAVCLGTSSETYMTVQYSKVRNNYAAPDGVACVSVTEFSQLWDTLTNTPAIHLCLSPKHKSDSSCLPWGCKPAAWGEADLFKGCNTCADISVLNMRFTSFTAKESGSDVQLNWSVSRSAAEFQFSVLASDDGKQYNLKEVQLKTKEAGLVYSAVDSKPGKDQRFYKIMAINRRNGLKFESPVIKLETEIHADAVYPNPFTDIIKVRLPSGYISGRIELSDLNGVKLIQLQAGPGTGRLHEIKLPASMQRGTYYLRLISGTGTVVYRLIHL